MPYFISDTNPDCGGWAVEKDDGEVMGCHETKQDAVDQMVALSIAEDMEPGGERSVTMETIPVQGRTSSNIEFRAVTGDLSGDGNTFVGYAAMFDVPSEPLPFIERIAQGAFGKTLRNRRRDVRMYVNHDSNLLLASKRSGTLRLEEDDRGLRVEADLPDTTYANDLRVLMQSGVVDKMSFGFQVPRGGDTWSDDGRERTLRQVELFEVSVVTGFPAYDQTTAAVRSLDRISTRTGMSVDDLTEVLDALADGETLDPVKADAIIAALMESLPKSEPEPVNLLGLKQKYHDLFAKQL
jgi:HK97 family phage prohead protease